MAMAFILRAISLLVFIVAATDDQCASPTQANDTSACLFQKRRDKLLLPVSAAELPPRWQGFTVEKLDMAFHGRTAGLSSDSIRCPRYYLALPLCTLLVTLLLVIFVKWYPASSREVSVSEQARSVGLFPQVCGLISYSIVIVEAYQLSIALDHGAAFSGQLIGIYMAASVLGSLIMSWMLRAYPDIWKMHAREVFVISQLLSLAGFGIYAAILYHLAQITVTSQATTSLSTALLTARAISGVGQGVSSNLLQVIFAYTSPLHERPAQMTRFVFVSTLGVGLGPMIAAASHLLDFCPAAGLAPRFELVGLAQIVLAGTALLCIVLFYPRLDDCEDFSQCTITGPELQESCQWTQRVIVCSCLVNTLLRAIVTSGVEGATSLLLETEYHFAPHEIGLLIGVTFLCCFPVNFIVEAGRQRFTEFTWIKALCLISILGTLLLFRRSWRSLVVADMLLFPSLYISDGILKGVMQQYALPMGSALDQVGSTFWSKLMNSAGRFIGPWVSRYLLENVNQTGYASLQVVLTLVFGIVLELAIIWPVHTVDWHLPTPRDFPSK